MKTEYRGLTISYGDNTDQWNCFDIGYSNVSIGKVKARIDAWFLKIRKESAVPCFVLSDISSGLDKTEGSIIEYVRAIEKRSWGLAKQEVIGIDHRVAVSALHLGGGRKSRQELDLNKLMVDTPGAHAAFAKAQQLYGAVTKARAAYTAAVEAIPRVGVESIQELVKIHETERLVGEE